MRIILLTLLFFPAVLFAEQWQFRGKILVTPAHGERVFHHLDSTGRNNLSVSNLTLAAVWEDNHKGSPQVFVATKKLAANKFNKPIKVSTGESAYSPVITPYKDDQFLIAWEQDGHIWISTLVQAEAKSVLSTPRKLSNSKGSKYAAVLKLNDNAAIVAWCKKNGRFSQVVTTVVSLDKNGAPVKSTAPKPIDKAPPKDNQLYPTISKINGLITVVWEDRRTGHTVLFYSQSKQGRIFTPYRIINDIVQKSPDYGRGNGVTRAAITSVGGKEAVVTWMDKRGFSTGYDIYAAQSDPKTRLFGKNHIVQDTLGNDISQWNPAITANEAGDVVVAWDDNRDDTSDIWFSWKTKEGWSDDYLIDPASGDGQQSGPSIVVDKFRNLHAIWIDQTSEFGPTRLYYSVGKFGNSN